MKYTIKRIIFFVSWSHGIIVYHAKQQITIIKRTKEINAQDFLERSSWCVGLLSFFFFLRFSNRARAWVDLKKCRARWRGSQGRRDERISNRRSQRGGVAPPGYHGNVTLSFGLFELFELSVLALTVARYPFPFCNAPRYPGIARFPLRELGKRLITAPTCFAARISTDKLLCNFFQAKYVFLSCYLLYQKF